MAGKSGRCVHQSRRVGPQVARPRMKSVMELFVGFAMILATVGCASQTSDSIHDSEPFQNPDFDCPTADVVEPGAGYPYPYQGYPIIPGDI